LTKDVTEEQVAAAISCGPDPKVHLRSIRAYLDAGYDHVYVHQIGPDQAGFLEFAQRELMGRLDAVAARR
jgi:hypothetical protein